MTQQSPPPVGIDLGTTYSAVARLNDIGRPETLMNSEGDKLTPSAVLFEDGEMIVGKEAIKALGTEADRVADCVKRELGTRLYHKLLGGRQYPPESIQALILNKLRIDAQRQLGPFDQVVITVPAYFDEVRRKATQDAGYIAGLTVLDIINEPTAAAVAFGFQRGFLRHDADADSPENILVYDLGGGTFDVTIMEIQGNQYVTLATDGDVQLGGRDWDQRLVDFVAEECIRKYGLDPREDTNTEGRLWRECEEAKRTLSARNRATITFDSIGQPVRVDVTRQAFQEMTRDLLDRTSFTVRQTLQAAGMEWSGLTRILLIGGSSRMPAVAEMLESMSGMTPDLSMSPDEAVAHGAALHAGLLMSDQERQPAFQIKNVNSHSLGVVGHDPKTKRPRNAIIIPRNTPLPVTAQRVFKTQKHNQKSIRVQIVEGETASPDGCSEIGKCTVKQLPPDLPPQTPIEVQFRYEANGRLTVLVRVAGETVEHEIMRENSLSSEQLESWRKFVSGIPW